MKFSLIICTYMRPEPLLNLLRSVAEGNLYPDEILIVDGSTNNATKQALSENPFKKLQYFKVGDANRGLTKQRNFGISKVAASMEIVCFLDDDTVLTPNYFKKLLDTYTAYPKALGVGGYIINDTDWKKKGGNEPVSLRNYEYDGWIRKDGARFILRKKLGLDSNRPPAHLPDFSHGRSVGFLPPSGKVYPVEQFMGGVASYRKKVLEALKFSTYFEGYGLYEDADFTFRLSKKGPLYVNTGAQLYHFHEPSGRPNQYLYGKMVVRNGWYVWRVRHPKPSCSARLKWNVTVWLLTFIRYGNALTGTDKKQAFTEALGRTIGWWTLLFNKPRVQ